MGAGPRDFNYVTPEEYFEIQGPEGHTLPQLKRMANDKRMCMVCEQPVWKLGGCGMCFSCWTGEADASSDYELK